VDHTLVGSQLQILYSVIVKPSNFLFFLLYNIQEVNKMAKFREIFGKDLDLDDYGEVYLEEEAKGSVDKNSGQKKAVLKN